MVKELNLAVICLETYEIEFKVGNSVYSADVSELVLKDWLKDKNSPKIVSIKAIEHYYKTTPLIKALREFRNQLRGF